MSEAIDLQTQGGVTGVDAVPAPFLDDITTTPLFFAEEILGLKLYDWQVDVLNWYIDPRRRVLGALCTPNGAGKSSGVVAALALWWVAIYPKGKVVITTKDSKQLDEQLYPALERHRSAGGDKWRWVTSPYIQIETPTGGKIVAFTTNDPGRAEGWHKVDDLNGPLLMIVDEAKSVESTIFEAIDRCTFNALLYVSSPGLMEGQFYDAFAKHHGLFKTRKVSLLECPHIPAEKIETMRIKYGVDSPLYRSSILGEFMEEGDVPYVFSRSSVQKAMIDPPRKTPGNRTAFCDFAAGGDENVIALREGNELSILDHWHERDTMAAITRFIMSFRKHGLTADNIFADNGGVGKPMIDALWKMGWEVNRVDNQSPPWDRNYINRGAEMWHETAGALRRSELRLDIPLDEQELLIAQLCSRRSRWNDLGRLGVEKKEDMARRGVKSPDRADALCGAYACHLLVQTREKSPFEDYEETYGEERDPYAIAGADAGY